MIHERIVAHQYFMYLSTIGNVNWFSGYICLIFPLILYDYINNMNILNIATISPALMSVLLLNCDSIFLGLGLMSFVIIPYIFKDSYRIKRVSEIILMFGICCIMLHFFSEKMSLTTGITKIIVNPAVIAMIVLLSLFFRYLSIKDNPNLYRVTMISLEIMILVCFVYFSWTLYDAVKTYNYYWGNNRLKIWNESMFIYKTDDYFSPLQRLFGTGPEMLKEWYYYLSQELKVKFLVSHSEPLQILLTMGIAGLASYMLIIVGIIRILNKDNFIYFLSFLAYFGQSLVNSATVMNIGILFVLLGLYMNSNINSA